MNESDLYCRSCAYNLRGLAEVGVCPECGISFGEPLGDEHYAYQGPAWGRGCAILAFGGLVLVLLALRLLYVGAGYLSVLIGPAGLMVEVAAMCVGVRAFQLGAQSRVIWVSMAVAGVTLGLCAIGAYTQLFLLIRK